MVSAPAASALGNSTSESPASAAVLRPLARHRLLHHLADQYNRVGEQDESWCYSLHLPSGRGSEGHRKRTAFAIVRAAVRFAVGGCRHNHLPEEAEIRASYCLAAIAAACILCCSIARFAVSSSCANASLSACIEEIWSSVERNFLAAFASNL